MPNATQYTQEIIDKERQYVYCRELLTLGSQDSTLTAASHRYIVQTYARPNMVLTHGEGARVYDAHGKEYLDFAAGIAVNSLGEQ